MSIIIDANLFSAVVSPTCKDHFDFQPVFEWIQVGHGKIVHGGSHYKSEVEKHTAFRKFLVQMEHKGKTVLITTAYVDVVEDYLKNNYNGKDSSGKEFDDHHIIALLLVSRCILICTKDKGLRELLNICYSSYSKKRIRKNCQHIGKGISPRIYGSRRNTDLLRDKYILS